MRIGVLEDDVAIQEMLLLVLQDEGYSVVTFPDAEACLAAFQAKANSPESVVDLMIIDWRLSGSLSGTEVIHKIRKQSRFLALPIILTTAATFNDPDELREMRVALLEKPFSVDDMAALIRDLTSSSPR
jgi:Response regulators consisting of a CheY-like receiver domain and a winged-helix DNA-binding domain